MTAQTIISVSVWAVLTTYETILNSLLAFLIRKNKNIYISFQRTPKCCYGNIEPVLSLMALCTNQRGKLRFMEICENPADTKNEPVFLNLLINDSIVYNYLRNDKIFSKYLNDKDLPDNLPDYEMWCGS